MFQSRVLSNRRPSKDSVDFKLTSTNGTAHLSTEALQTCKFKVDDCVVIAALPIEGTGMAPTRPDGDEIFYITKGFKLVQDAEGKTTQRQVGNTITDTNNHNVISAANVYQELGGSTDCITNFDLGEATYGFLVVEGKGTPITADSAEDEGDVWAQVVTTAPNGQKGLDFVQVADVATAKETAVPFFPLTFVNTTEKQIKAGAKGGPKAPKAAKAPTAVEVELDDFDA